MRGLLKSIWITIRAIWITVATIIVHFYQRPFQAMLNSLFLVILLFITNTASKFEDNIIRSQIPNSTVNKLIDASNYTRRFNAVKVDSQGARELVSVGAPVWSQESGVRAVLFHARKAKLSIEHQAVLLSIVEIESGFNPFARAITTSACGLFQFVKATGERYSLTRKDCMNPWKNAQAGVDHYIDNYEKRIKTVVSDLSGSKKVFRLFELGYHLHHDGAQSAAPSDKAKTVVLRGTPFLLEAYDILKTEFKSKEQLTGVVELLVVNLRATYEKFMIFFRQKIG